MNRNVLSSIQKHTGQAWEGIRKFLPSQGRKPDRYRHPGHLHVHTSSAARRMHSVCVLCRKTCSQDGRHWKLLLNIPQSILGSNYAPDLTEVPGWRPADGQRVKGRRAFLRAAVTWTMPLRRLVYNIYHGQHNKSPQSY